MDYDLKSLREEHLARQNTASDPQYSVWVSANAGAGKTHILVERIIRLLLPPCQTPPHKILCITYTKAAAAEMTERLFKRLGEWITKSDEELEVDISKIISRTPNKFEMIEARRLFARALETPGGLKIQTIHGFCEQILRRFPLESGYRKDFTVLTETDTENLYSDAIDRLLQETMSFPESLLSKAFQTVSQVYKLSVLKKLVIDGTTRKTYQETIETKGYFWDSDDLLRFLELPCEDQFEQIHAQFWNQIDTDYIEALCSAIESGKNKIQLASQLKEMITTKFSDINHAASIFLTAKLTPKKIETLLNKEVAIRYPELTQYLKKLSDQFTAYHQQYTHIQTYELTKALSIILIASYEYIEKVKSEQGLSDFNDLILRTKKILSDHEIAPWILWKLDGGIDHILVDEAQDTSGEQWDIIRAIADEFFSQKPDHSQRTIFAVGDEKQSIYSFQGAEPRKMSENAVYFQTKITSTSHQWVEQELRGSFRSAPAILKLTDAIFETQARQGIIFKEDTQIKHYAVANPGPGYVEIMPISYDDPQQQESVWEQTQYQSGSLKGRIKNAQKIAQKIDVLLKSDLILPSTKRPPEPRDILILVRTRGSDMRLLIRELNILRIPVAGIDRITLLEEPAVLDLLALIDFVLFPDDDLTLAQILRSPLCYISEEELFDLCHNRGQSTLWYILQQKASEKENFNAAYRFLKDMLSQADYESPHEFLNYVLENHHGRKLFIQRLGYDCLDGIDELLNKTLSFVTNHTISLQSFVSFIRHTGGSQKRETENVNNQVKIMTVHGSKGLEAPIVFLADTCKEAQGTRELSSRLILTQNNLPICLKFKSNSSILTQEKHYHHRISLEEYHRLLYVAITRAKDRLYVCGSKTKPKSEKNTDDTQQEQQDQVSRKTWYDYITQGILTLDGVQSLEDTLDKTQTYYCYEDKNAYPKFEPSHSDDQHHLFKKNLPDWIKKPITYQQEIELNLIKPSQATEKITVTNNDFGRQRGIIIHKLLEVLPRIKPHEQREAAEKLLKHYPLEITVKNKLISEAFGVINHAEFSQLFSAQSLCEVPIIGKFLEFTNQGISGQIDRMVVTHDSVLIADYKSDKFFLYTQDIPTKYTLQMALYRRALMDIYKYKTIRCFLIATCIPSMIEILPTEMDLLLEKMKLPKAA